MNGRALRQVVLLSAVALTIGCDRVTKQVAVSALAGTAGHSFLGDTVRVLYAENTGGFLGFGADMPPLARTLLFSVATGLALIATIAFAARRTLEPTAALGLALFLAGGASNLYDRIARGHVVDFLNLGIGPVRTGIFNAADVAIMAGIVLVLVDDMRRRAREQQNELAG